MKTKPLNQKAYGHIPHLPGSRLGVGDHHCHEGQARMCCEKSKDKRDRVIVQEKLDGTCVSVALLDGKIVPLIRAGYLATDSHRRQHHLFAAWAFEREDAFRALLKEGQRACGEWLVQAHGTRYDLPHEPFVLFDLMDGHERIGSAEWLARMAGIVGFATPRVIHIGEPISIEKVVSMLEPSGHGALDPVEGAVWRVERHGVAVTTELIAKYVKHDKQDGSYFAQGEVWNTWRGWRAIGEVA